MIILEIDNLSRSFGGLQAVDDVDFQVKRGAIKAVIGPNGAGKTTLFNLITGNIPADSGRIVFNGSSIYGLPPYQVASRGIARTFQNIKLYTGMTALENVMVGRHLRSSSGFPSSMLKLPRTWKEEKAIRQNSMELLDFLGMTKYADQEVSNLAFGQQRSVEFARALAMEPQLLLLDEPAAGLNMYETAEIADLITTIRDQGITILLVEHDMSLVMDISDEILVLNFGRKIAEDKPAAIQANPEVIQIYLGEEDA